MIVRVELNGETLFDSSDGDSKASRTQAVRAIALVFAELNDDEQALFFEDVGKAFDKFDGAGRWMQLQYIAGHLATCNCISNAARGWILDLAEALKAEIA